MNNKYMAVGVVAIAGFAASTGNAALVYSTDDASLDIGGRLQTNYNSVRVAENKKNDKAELDGKARFHVDATSKIIDGLKANAFGEWEAGASTHQNGKWNTRYAYVGFKTDNYGVLNFGQNQTPMHDVIGKTDVFIDWGSKGNTYVEYASKGRQEGIIRYELSHDFSNALNVNFGAGFQSASLDNVDSGEIVAAGITYGESFPVGLGVGYDHYDVQEGSKYKYDDRDSFSVGISGGDLSDDGLYLGAVYNFTKYDKKENKNGYEAVAGYNWKKPGIKLITGYQYLEEDSATLVSSITAEVSYNFNKSFKTYIESEFGVGDIDTVDILGRKVGSTDDTSGDLFSWGLQYNF